MQFKLLVKSLVIGIIVLFIGGSINPSTAVIDIRMYNSDEKTIVITNEGTEYWALIFAVGIYKNKSNQDRPQMIEAANDLEEVLLKSPNWEKDHIHKVTGSEATGRRLIRELIWLISKEDSDDMSLIYLTTHGSPLRGPLGSPIDIPPFDEHDGADEILIMYEGFDKWYGFIWDDLLNFFLSLLQSKGICLIVDSCFSGGFNDNPMFDGTKYHSYSSKSFSKGLAEELSAQNRVVLMSCKEYEICYGSYFSEYLIDGLWGEADIYGNQDGINSAEEAFNYSNYLINELCSFNPVLIDFYPGEYPVT
jgi:hypothetical protein